jgi:hypothetical protein
MRKVRPGLCTLAVCVVGIGAFASVFAEAAAADSPPVYQRDTHGRVIGACRVKAAPPVARGHTIYASAGIGCLGHVGAKAVQVCLWQGVRPVKCSAPKGSFGPGTSSVTTSLNCARANGLHVFTAHGTIAVQGGDKVGRDVSPSVVLRLNCL